MRLLSLCMTTLVLSTLAGCGPEKTDVCPNWSSNPVQNYANEDFSNFGCAYHNNIAVQLSNPDDLISGHGVQTQSGDRESVNVQKYLTATPQQISSQSTTTGTTR